MLIESLRTNILVQIEGDNVLYSYGDISSAQYSL